MNNTFLDSQEKALVTVKKGVKDLIKINAAYRRMSITDYLEMLVVKDLELSEVKHEDK